MCLDTKDAELGRPRLRKEADTVIEVKKEVRKTNESIASKVVYAYLIKLDDLRKKGIITDAEFDAQKRKLLSAN